MSLPTLINQDPRDPAGALYLKIAKLLRDPELQTAKLMVSYANWQGFSMIADPLEAFLARGGVVQSLFGIDNGVTTPDALIYAHYLSKRFASYRLAAVVPWLYADSIFHPKFFQFDFKDRSIVMIGSGNLTGGGFQKNHEIGLQLVLAKTDPAYLASRRTWRKYVGDSRPITLKLIRKLAASDRLAKERQRAEAPANVSALPRISLPFVGRSRPALFKHILVAGLPAADRHAALAHSDALSTKPKRLYLQILNETGGGHQIQLPVATLGAFFAVGTGRSKPVRFRFPGETVNVTLTHFPNNTHRVRLKPLQGVPRPAIVTFRRTQTADEYECVVATGHRYARLLKVCTEQTRTGSRRWGLT